MTDPEQQVKWLNEAFWPWPLALAYSQDSDVRGAAIEACVRTLESYDAAGMGSEQYRGVAAVQRVLEVVTGQEGLSPTPVELMSIEAGLWRSIHDGRCTLFGRASPFADLQPLTAEQLVGREVSPEQTCDLVVGGWAAKANSLSAVLGETQRVVSFYDLHLRRAELEAAFSDKPDERSLAVEPTREPPNGWVDHGRREDETLILDEYMAEAGPPRDGYWTIFSALAWVVSKDPRYVAAVQIYETRHHANRGSANSVAAWICLGDDAGTRFGKTFTSASFDLREKLETGAISGIGTERRSGLCRPIERHEWTQWAVHHENDGICFMPNVRDCQFPAQDVRTAFPASEEAVGPDSLPSSRSGFPGRPTSKALTTKIFQQRVEAGDVRNSLQAEAEEVARQFNDDPRFREWPRVSPLTVKNHIRSAYHRCQHP